MSSLDDRLILCQNTSGDSVVGRLALEGGFTDFVSFLF